MNSTRHQRSFGLAKRADIPVGSTGGGGGGGTRGPRFPRPRSPTPSFPLFCSGEERGAVVVAAAAGPPKLSFARERVHHLFQGDCV